MSPSLFFLSGGKPPLYPVPWAENESISAMVTESQARSTIEETGLEIELTGLLGLWLDQYVSHATLNIYYLARNH